LQLNMRYNISWDCVALVFKLLACARDCSA
jgi:hypothetical protein